MRRGAEGGAFAGALLHPSGRLWMVISLWLGERGWILLGKSRGAVMGALGGDHLWWLWGLLAAAGFAGGEAVGFAALEVGDGDGEGVGGVGGWGFAEAEHGADHEGDLLFGGGAASDSGLFDFARGVFVDGEAVFGGGDEGGAAGGAEDDGGFEALDEDGGFDGADGGLELADDVVELFADGDEAAGGEEFGVVGDGAVGEGAEFFASGFDDGEAGFAEGGVDGEDALCGGGLHEDLRGRLVALGAGFAALGADAEKFVEGDGAGAEEGEGEGDEEVEPAEFGEGGEFGTGEAEGGDAEEHHEDGEKAGEEADDPGGGDDEEAEGGEGGGEVGHGDAFIDKGGDPFPRDFLPEEMIGVEDGIPGVTRHEDDARADSKDGGGFEEGAEGILRLAGIGAVGFEHGAGCRSMVCGEVDDVASGEAPFVGGGDGAEVAFLAFAGDVEAVGAGAWFASAGEADGVGDGDAVVEGEGLRAGGEVAFDGDDGGVFDGEDVDGNWRGGHAGDAKDGADGDGGFGEGEAAEFGGADFADLGGAVEFDDGEAFPEGFGGAEAFVDLQAEGVAGAEGAAGVEVDVGVLAVDFIGTAGKDAGDLGEVGERRERNGGGVFFDGVTGAEAEDEPDGEEGGGAEGDHLRRGCGRRQDAVGGGACKGRLEVKERRERAGCAQ